MFSAVFVFDISKTQVQKNKRNVKAKKKQRHTKTSCINKEQNGVLQKQSSSSCSSENDSTASHELNGVASNSSESKEARTINSNGQPRAVRGSATDPQSLYARVSSSAVRRILYLLFCSIRCFPIVFEAM